MFCAEKAKRFGMKHCAATLEGVWGEFDPKGGDAETVGRACEPYGHRTQIDYPRTGSRGGSPLPPEAYAILLHADEMPDADSSRRMLTKVSRQGPLGRSLMTPKTGKGCVS